MTFLTSSPHSHAVSFQEFRDFLLLLPRKASPEEIFRFYEVKKFMGDDGRGAARVNMEGECVRGQCIEGSNSRKQPLTGDVSLSAEDMATIHTYSSGKDVTADLIDHMDHDDDYYEEDELVEEEHHSWLDTSLAARFLLAGGVAGAGTPLALFSPFSILTSSSSFENMHSTIRPSENLPHHSTPRNGWNLSQPSSI